jgi:lysophospholipid hydrolase
LDARSTTSSVQSGSDIFGNSNKSHDLISPDDIQILYFPKDAVLVKEGAHDNGLFFVIDGFLEVSMTPSMGEDGFTTDSKKSKKPLSRQKSRIIDTGFKSPHQHTKASSNNSTSAKEDHVVASDVPAGRNREGSKHGDGQEKVKKPLFIIKPGHLAGYLGALTGFPSFVEIKAKTDTYVGYVSKKRLDKIIDKNPAVMLKLAHQLVGHVSPLSK